MTTIEAAQAALEFYEQHPNSPAGHLASALEALLADHKQAVKDRDDWHDESQRLSNRLDEIPAAVPSHKEFSSLVAEERDRQVEIGYTAEHDDERGIRHLLGWAVDYARRGENAQSAALIWAALDVLDRGGMITDALAEEVLTTFGRIPHNEGTDPRESNVAAMRQALRLAGYVPVGPITNRAIAAGVDVMLHEGLAGRTWPDYARAVLQAAREADRG